MLEMDRFAIRDCKSIEDVSIRKAIRNMAETDGKHDEVSKMEKLFFSASVLCCDCNFLQTRIEVWRLLRILALSLVVPKISSSSKGKSSVCRRRSLIFSQQ